MALKVLAKTGSEHGDRILRRFERDVFPWLGKRPSGTRSDRRPELRFAVAEGKSTMLQSWNPSALPGGTQGNKGGGRKSNRTLANEALAKELAVSYISTWVLEPMELAMKVCEGTRRKKFYPAIHPTKPSP